VVHDFCFGPESHDRIDADDRHRRVVGADWSARCDLFIKQLARKSYYRARQVSMTIQLWASFDG
jgi:hypothetical protein